MRTGKDRVQVEATQVPVNIGLVRVCPGDLIRGDADGVVVIPAAFEEKVLTAAEQIQSSEDAIRASVRGGMTLREAREKHRYHHLQTRADS
jgi:regulator of RNase E activity RraA